MRTSATGDEVCASGTCGVATALDCDDGDMCTADACDATSGCSNTGIDGCCNADLECDDGDACTDDTCSGAGGVCTSTAIADCGVDGGCSCRVQGPRPEGGHIPPLGLAVLLFVVGRRRRSRLVRGRVTRGGEHRENSGD